MIKLAGVTGVNMGASLVKDITFVKLFGAKKEVAAKVPLATYAIFLSRDTLTIAGGFTVPPIISKLL